MEFLRITAADGTKKYIPDNYVVSITTAADTLDAGSDYRAPNVVRGRITEAKYTDGTTVTTDTVAAYTGANALYEYGCYTVDGAFVAAMKN
jgi:hypothetical protein